MTHASSAEGRAEKQLLCPLMAIVLSFPSLPGETISISGRNVRTGVTRQLLLDDF
jgi:hypothetical protein